MLHVVVMHVVVRSVWCCDSRGCDARGVTPYIYNTVGQGAHPRRLRGAADHGEAYLVG